jgi:hypothetical protein
MKIDTKYAIGQTVWTIMKHHNPEPVSYEIKKIQVRDYYGKLQIEYSFSDDGNALTYTECQLHPTKEACKATTSA